jgi:hypothetical protein
LIPINDKPRLALVALLLVEALWVYVTVQGLNADSHEVTTRKVQAIVLPLVVLALAATVLYRPTDLPLSLSRGLAQACGVCWLVVVVLALMTSNLSSKVVMIVVAAGLTQVGILVAASWVDGRNVIAATAETSLYAFVFWFGGGALWGLIGLIFNR